VYVGVGTRVSSRSFICLCSYICFSIPDLLVGLFHVTFSRFHSCDMGIELPFSDLTIVYLINNDVCSGGFQCRFKYKFFRQLPFSLVTISMNNFVLFLFVVQNQKAFP
jgi:hypothetical protein